MSPSELSPPESLPSDSPEWLLFNHLLWLSVRWLPLLPCELSSQSSPPPSPSSLPSWLLSPDDSLSDDSLPFWFCSVCVPLPFDDALAPEGPMTSAPTATSKPAAAMNSPTRR